MTVKECFEKALSLVPELLEESVDTRRFAVTWCNILLAETLKNENLYRKANGIKEIKRVPQVFSEKDEIPYNEEMVMLAFPYGMARWIFRENDDVSGSHEYYQLYATAVMEATPMEIIEITDVYR